MENPAEKLFNNINLRTREIRILIPGHFNLIHAGHLQLIQDVKNSFRKVNLIIGIIDDNDSVPLLGLHEKLETFKSFPEIDKICVLHSKPSLSDLKALNVDYIATAKSDFPNSSKVLRFEKKVFIDSDAIFARVIRDYDSHLENLLQAGFKAQDLNVPKRKEIGIMCRRNLRKVKKAVCSERFSLESIEKALDASRRWLQTVVSDWGEVQERNLRRWLGKCKSSVSKLYLGLGLGRG